MKIIRFFSVSILITLVGLGVALYFGGLTALYITGLLIILEVTLSFDNAVVNARVLKRMNALWQRRFLTWGILVAVFGTRFVLPIAIVSIIVWASPIFVAELAIFDPEHYGELLEGAKYAIHSFGAAFLMMVSLKYFLDSKKKVHWFKKLEEHLTLWGRVEAIEIVLALLAIVGISFLVSPEVFSVLFYLSSCKVLRVLFPWKQRRLLHRAWHCSYILKCWMPRFH
jgi:hypothetical protein